MKQYQQYIADILNRGVVKSDRTGVGTVSAFGHFLRFDLSEGFPLLTLKRTNFKGIKAELLWFLEGSTDNNRLRELGATIWDEWATESGELGPIYGYQWRSWPLPYEKDPRGLVQRVMDAIKGVPAPRKPYDQIRHIQFQLRINPTNRRLVLTGWNPEFLPDAGFSPQTNVEMGKQALPPCHMSFVFNATPIRVEDRIELGAHLGKFRSAAAVAKGLEIRLKGVDPDDVDRVSQAWLTEEFGVPEYRLNGLLTMRSNDATLGAPYNIASYALLIEMMAQSVGMLPGELCVAVADGHIYLNHLDAAKELLRREPKPLCRLRLNSTITDIDDFTMDDIEIEDYVAHPAISLEVAV